MKLREMINKFIGRAMPIEAIYTAAWDMFEEEYREGGSWRSLHDVYMDNGEAYVVYFSDGLAYRQNFIVQDGEVRFEDPQQIEFIHTPVSRGNMKVTRTKDGQLVWYAVAGSAVVNRDGEIDSTLLFDNFVEEFDNYEHKPFLTFYHQHEEKWRFGDVLGVKREGHLLLAWGTINETHTLGKAAALSINSGEYGMSIGFRPTIQARAFKVSEDVEIPTYDEGVLVEISLLEESDAAAQFTKIKTN